MTPFAYVSDAEEWMDEHASGPMSVCVGTGRSRWELDWLTPPAHPPGTYPRWPNERDREQLPSGATHKKNKK